MNGHDHGISMWASELKLMKEAMQQGEFMSGVDLSIHARGHEDVPERRHITSDDLEFGILHNDARIFEGYPPEPQKRRPFPRRLIITRGKSGYPLHISVAIAPYGYLIVTYYDPSLSWERWHSDYMSRRKGRSKI